MNVSIPGRFSVQVYGRAYVGNAVHVVQTGILFVYMYLCTVGSLYIYLHIYFLFIYLVFLFILINYLFIYYFYTHLTIGILMYPTSVI